MTIDMPIISAITSTSDQFSDRFCLLLLTVISFCFYFSQFPYFRYQFVMNFGWSSVAELLDLEWQVLGQQLELVTYESLALTTQEPPIWNATLPLQTEPADCWLEDFWLELWTNSGRTLGQTRERFARVFDLFFDRNVLMPLGRSYDRVAGRRLMIVPESPNF